MNMILKNICLITKTSFNFWISIALLGLYIVPGDPKKSIPLFGVLGGTQVFAKQQKRYMFGFPTKNLTISNKYFQRLYCQKKNICNSAVFNPTALLQISYVKITLRLHVDISLIANRISYHNQYFEGFSYIYCANQL